MKFFSRAWVSGEITDEQASAVPEAYSRYLTTLHLPPAIAALSRVNPHDALVLSVEYLPESSRLKLRLRCGDLQSGYSDIAIAFHDVSITPASLETLISAIRPARVEVLYDEVDCSGEYFEYRLLLHPKGEVSIRFQEVDVKERLVSNREAM
jgi:hypothetical protein